MTAHDQSLLRDFRARRIGHHIFPFRLECISSTPGLGQDRFEGGGICGYKSLYYKVNAIQLISNM